MSNELERCPFCGGEARLDQRVTQSLWNSNDAVFSHATCDECDISGQDFCDDPDGEEAIEWWNRRAQPAEAEGVKRWAIDVDCLYPSEEGGWCEYGDHIAALSAVTAERDAFREARNCLVEENTLLYEQIADLTEERDRLRRSQQVLMQSRNAHRDERDQLRAEVEALRPDAERYRWLCDGNGYFMEEAGLCNVTNEKDEADRQIDAAMAAKEGV